MYIELLFAEQRAYYFMHHHIQHIFLNEMLFEIAADERKIVNIY